MGRSRPAAFEVPKVLIADIVVTFWPSDYRAVLTKIEF
jgi:hypothetical protein